MHILLQQQLNRLGLADQSPPPSPQVWQELLTRVSQAYTEFDRGRTLYEGSSASSSHSSQSKQKRLHDIQTVSELRIQGEQGEAHTLMESALDAIVSMDHEGRIIAWNSQARETFGWSDQEVFGQLLSDTIIPEEHREALREGFRRFWQTGEDPILNQRLEMWALHRDGHVFPVEIAIIPIYKEEACQFYCFIRDISERQQAMTSLREAKEEAEMAAQMKSQFLATMSHEIRTPMNGVIGMTGLLLETDLAPQQRKYAETVRSSSEALLTIINDILDFSKIEAGKLEFEIIDFDLRVALEESLELLAEKAGEKHLELVGLVSGNVPTALRGDPGRLRQVLLNLAGNAIKFTERGEVIVRIYLLEESGTDVQLRFEVSDTGIGIPVEVQNRLFQPFSQAESSTTRRFGGTGLGLAISQQLVELMQGTIGVESAQDQGSTFWFTIRLHKQSPNIPEDTLSSKSLQGLRLCCVDDHPINLQLLSQYAEDWGMDHIMASTPAEALSLLQERVTQGQSVDLAILDMEMPSMDGLTLARVIKADPRLASVQLVLLTSLGRRGDAKEARDAGFSGYLTKPIRKAQLQECLLVVMNQLPPQNEGGQSSSLITRYSLNEVRRQARIRILVADDHRVNQQLAVLMLERLGYRADVVANGQEALEAFTRQPYDLVLMDCQMPEMDGYKATKEIRRREASDVKREAPNEPRATNNERRDTPKRVPIIAMTANAMQGDREKCLNAGMNDYLSKPIKPNQLEAMLTQWLPTQDSLVRDEGGEHSQPQAHDRDPNDERQNASDEIRTSPGASLPGAVDEAVLNEWRSMGGQNFVSRMVAQFISDATACVTALEYAIQQNELTQIHEIAHGLKGICRNMGAEPLGNLCLLLEKDDRHLSQKQLARTFCDLQAEFQRVCQTFERETVR